MEKPPFWWDLLGNMVIFRGYVSLQEGRYMFNWHLLTNSVFFAYYLSHQADYAGVIKLPILGDQTLQIYGSFQGIPL